MASNKLKLPNQIRDSISSTISLWDKLPETKQVSIDIANENDFVNEDNVMENEIEDELQTSNNNFMLIYEQHDQIKLIANDGHIEEVKVEFQKCLSNQGIRWVLNGYDRIHSWNFGLSLIRFQLESLHSIDPKWLIPIRSSPFWIQLKNTIQQKQRFRLNSEGTKPTRLKYSHLHHISLRYGALIKLDEFRYAPKYSWSNQSRSRWSLVINNKRSGGCIEWIIEGSRQQEKKQLLVMNIDQTVIIHLLSDGFLMYICQKCNMNEFIANENLNNFVRIPYVYEKDKRSNNRKGIYFPTVQFELRIDRNNLMNKEVPNRVGETYNELTTFFTLHNITVCHGAIKSCQGPEITSFLPMQFDKLIMQYSWEMLTNIGYRLQVQIDKQFRDSLRLLSEEKDDADDLFYRVCVYLSRLFTLEPFVNLSEKLHNAIIESKRKRENSIFGLINSLNQTSNTETYVPSVTLTPTTIRIKPLKLCRTNRVLRAEQEFGKALEHFALVEIRDENGQPLQSFHFQDLHQYFLDYLQNGFTLMGNDRYYRYLHHSQSQLRASQFWFYYHEPRVNKSFDDAYRWMGDFSEEKNIAKYASRIALCFSTTTPSIDIDEKYVEYIDDIKTQDGKLKFTDGCGTMSEKLRNDIQKQIRKHRAFSAVQFRYAGAKGVVSVDPQLQSDCRLRIRYSMKKFVSSHRCFEVCKVSAPRSLYLNRQVILLLSNRCISDVVFLILQQRNHLTLIRALLRNDDAKYLLDEKLPNWFLPDNCKIDFVREPFFRHLVITACLLSVRDLLRRTRIRIPRNKARNMIGIIDEYNVLKENEVFIQYTIMNDDEDKDHNNNHEKTQILHQCQVVVTKNPCHHPGDVRTFTAVNHKALKHLKDVIVFSQQGNCPASHQISGSDLDGDEYAIIWHEDLVPVQTRNATPFDFDSQTKTSLLDRPVTRNDINSVVLKICESDLLGRLSNLHLAYADICGVNSNERPAADVLSTIELAAAISQEVDSGKTGHHSLDENQMTNQKRPLGNIRPDFMENTNLKSYRSEKILGKLYRSSRRMLPGWNRLLRRHRHLRHLQVRTSNEDEEIDDDQEDEEANTDDVQRNTIPIDSSLLNTNLSPQDHEWTVMASQLFYVYRQEMLEILNLYGLSHESDLWCRKSTNTIGGELEDTAYIQLKQLVARTRSTFFLSLLTYCEDNESNCSQNTLFEDLCPGCKKRHKIVANALYQECYSGQNGSERPPILSLPWLFTTTLLQKRESELSPTKGLLSAAMEVALNDLIKMGLLKLGGMAVTLRTSNNCEVETNLDWTVCVFVEIINYCLRSKSFNLWPRILSLFIFKISSFEQDDTNDEWLLLLTNNPQDDLYGAILISMEWTENEDELMHSYFDRLLEICFDLSQSSTTNNEQYLQISEEILQILQRVAIEETI